MEPRIRYRNEVLQCPLRIVLQQTKQKVASRLDSHKVLLTEKRFHRDWRGIAELTNLDVSVIQSGKISPTEHCFYLLSRDGVIIKQFIDALQNIDRYDVIDDCLKDIYNDFDTKSSLQSFKLECQLPTLTQFDDHILTTEDALMLSTSGHPQKYDALVLYAEEDLEFVQTLVNKLEGEFLLKLCLPRRDLLAGSCVETSILCRLLHEERCARLIACLSEHFLSLPENIYLMQVAHAIGIEGQRRVLVPVRLPGCTFRPPPPISLCHILSLPRAGESMGSITFDPWFKLARSVSLQPLSVAGRLQIAEGNKLSDSADVVVALSKPKVASSNNEMKATSKAQPHKNDIPSFPNAPSTTPLTSFFASILKNRNKKKKKREEQLFYE